jgi:hypothetical protein
MQKSMSSQYHTSSKVLQRGSDRSHHKKPKNQAPDNRSRVRKELDELKAIIYLLIPCLSASTHISVGSSSKDHKTAHNSAADDRCSHAKSICRNMAFSTVFKQPIHQQP